MNGRSEPVEDAATELVRVALAWVAGSGGGESITLADVKVGDSVVGRGALKNGVFVPTELGVMDAAAMGQRRRRGQRRRSWHSSGRHCCSSGFGGPEGASN